MLKFYWEGSKREIQEGKKSSIVLNNDAVSEWEELLSLLEPGVFLTFTSISHINVGGKYSLQVIFQFKLDRCVGRYLAAFQDQPFYFQMVLTTSGGEKTQQERFIYKMGDSMTCGHSGGGDIGTY